MLKLKNMKQFSKEVEKLVKDKELLYIEAVVERLQETGVELESAKARNLISPKIRKKILSEAKKYHMIRR